jgi:tellurite resistance protein
MTASARPPAHRPATPPSIKEFDEPRLEALIEAMFLAAYSDGEFSDVERAHFYASIESLTDRRISGPTVESLTVRMKADLEVEGRAARLEAVKEKLSSPGARKAALALTIQLIAADGIIRTAERELIDDMAAVLEIDQDTAADLVTQLTS